MFLDLEHSLRTEGEFKYKYEQLASKLKLYSDKAASNPAYMKQVRDTNLQILRLTKFNLVPFLGYYFPKYPKNKPFSLRYYPFAYAMYNLNLGRTSYTVIRGSRQISKTTNIAIRNVLSCLVIPRLSALTICPRPEQMKTIGDKYKEVYEAYRFYGNTARKRNNLFYKEFPSDSKLKIAYILTNPDKIRGNSVDWIDYDEYQDFDMTLELEINETISASDLPMITYSGTSKTIDSALESRFETSSRSFWGMKCNGCGHLNIPTVEEGVFDMIQLQGPSCVKCGKLLDVADGHWEHSNMDMLHAGRVGLHVPKLIVPNIVRDRSKWLTIYSQAQASDKKKFLEEVLGIPTQEGAREITVKELESICTLGEISKLQDRAKRRKYHYVISGCDWGGSDYLPAHNLKQSYTVHVMLGVNENWDFELIHFAKYSGMNYREIAEHIVGDHKRFNGDAIATDYGVGAAYNMLLRESLDQNTHVIFNYTSPDSKFLAPPKNNNDLYNKFSLNRTDSITDLFEAIKSGHILAPKWEQSSEYLKDFLNLIRNPQDSPSGGKRLTYIRHGSKPDDIVHGVNFAFQLGRVLIKEPCSIEKVFMDQVLVNLSKGIGRVQTPVMGRARPAPMSLSIKR